MGAVLERSPMSVTIKRNHPAKYRANTDNLVKSISEEQKALEPGTGEKQQQAQPRPRRTYDRQGKNAKRIESLRSSDVSRPWPDIHRIVSHDPLVRASHS